MAGRGFLFDLMDEIENSGRIHQSIVSKVEGISGRTLVLYYANPGHPGGAMVDADPDLLENVLRSLPGAPSARRLDLLITSPGGSPFAAEKLVRVCRAFSTEFRTIVLGRAMSAATLLCFGADELLMSETGNLGPIDPQMVQTTGPGQQRLVAANVIIESFRQMLAAAQQAIAAGQPADPFLHVLGTMDPRAVVESINAIQATQGIAKELLATGLLKGKPASQLDPTIQSLLDEGKKGLHGKHIYAKAVIENHKLPVTVIGVGTPLDLALRELHVRTELYAQRKGLAKYLLTANGGVDINVQLLQVTAGPRPPG